MTFALQRVTPLCDPLEGGGGWWEGISTWCRNKTKEVI